MASPIEILLKDPLSDVTRRERRLLLGACAIAITMVKTGLVPSKISALGIDFSPGDQKSLLWIAALVVFYFVGAFLTYGISDFISWRVAFHDALRDIAKQRYEESRRGEDPDIRGHAILEEMEKLGVRNYRWGHMSKPVSLLRASFDFGLPIVLGIYTIVALLLAPAPSSTPNKGAQSSPQGAMQLMPKR